MRDLLQTTFWLWDVKGDVSSAQALNLRFHKGDVTEAGAAYDSGQVDGFITIPTAALAFQWTTQARFVTDLRIRYLVACVMISRRAWDHLDITQQDAIRAAAAKAIALSDEAGKKQDNDLLGGLFARQGVQSVPVSDEFREQFATAARAALSRIDEKSLPRALLERVERLQKEYRVKNANR
jgi:TRAP-type C4-dicarboxylate transport system substrate-binding protein